MLYGFVGLKKISFDVELIEYYVVEQKLTSTTVNSKIAIPANTVTTRLVTNTINTACHTICNTLEQINLHTIVNFNVDN